MKIKPTYPLKDFKARGKVYIYIYCDSYNFVSTAHYEMIFPLNGVEVKEARGWSGRGTVDALN